jgi:polar amino acid transport system substrate-binding protein
MLNTLKSGRGLIAALFASVLSIATAYADSTLENAKKSGSVTVGLANEKPYAYVETDGKVTGAIIEVLRAALQPMGITKIEANVNEFSALVPGLMANRFDIIGAGMYVTAKRCESIAFTNPLTQIATVLASKKGNPGNIHALEDIAASKTLKVGTQLGTAQVDDLHRAGIPDDRIVLFSRDTEAMDGLQAGRVDAIYYPALEISELIAKTNAADVERISPFTVAKGDDGKLLLNYQSLGFRKEDADFIAAINEQLAALRKSGKLAEILKPFGFTELDLPDETVTAEKICSGS